MSAGDLYSSDSHPCLGRNRIEYRVRNSLAWAVGEQKPTHKRSNFRGVFLDHCHDHWTRMQLRHERNDVRKIFSYVFVLLGEVLKKQCILIDEVGGFPTVDGKGGLVDQL